MTVRRIKVLSPAWRCAPWAVEGCPVRSDGDWGPGGKLIKFFAPVLRFLWSLEWNPISRVRHAVWRFTGGPATLHYRRLTPDYTRYWMADSDAVNSLSRYEMALWFTSRDDTCLNCEELESQVPLLITVRKKAEK